MRRARGFTLLELLISLALFAIVGVALVTLLAQGMDVFTTGTGDTSLQDRFQAFWPTVREDLASVHVGDRTGVPPPPTPPRGITAAAAPTPGRELAPPRPPDLRLRSGWVRLLDSPSERPAQAFVAAWVRTNAREAEDPVLGATGVGAATTELQPFTPATVDSGVLGNLLPTGGLLEVAYVALHVPPTATAEAVRPSVLTVFRCFRAPVGGKGSLLDVESLDTVAEIRAAGRPVLEGVLHFSVTWRNVFATSWDVAGVSAKVADGEGYVGTSWDSTRGDERWKDFALHAGKESLVDARDDVFPARARVDLVLANPAPFGWRAETFLARPLGVDDTRVYVADAEPLVVPGPAERWVKVGEEWMLGNVAQVSLVDHAVTVVRGRRSTRPAEHAASDPVWIGSAGSTEVELVPKDRYVRRRR